MTTAESLDELIKKYSNELVKAYEKRNPGLPDNTAEENSETISAAQANTFADDNLLGQDMDSLLISQKNMSEQEAENQPTERETAAEQGQSDIDEDPTEALTGKATFFADVSTGGGAYPVANAKVIVGKNDTIYAFLVTDENGNTPKVTLPAYPAADALNPATVKTVEYYADVYASGFEEKRNLEVSAVGDSNIILTVELTPMQERTE